MNVIHPAPRTAEDTESRPDTLINFQPNKAFWGTFTEYTGYVTITPKSDSVLKPYRNISRIPFRPPDNNSLLIGFETKLEQLKHVNFVPDVLLDSFPQKAIVFFDSKPVLQTLTIPIKIRPRIKRPELKDSIPSQVTTSVNLGVALGWKFSLNYYQPNPNLLGQKGNKISLSPGLFYNIGASSLTKANTRSPVISFERTAFTNTVGGFAMFGFNSINIGYAFGWDFATGTGSKSWLYQGRLWHGIAFSLDLIK